MKKLEITYEIKNQYYTLFKETHSAEIDSDLWNQLITVLKLHGDMYSDKPAVENISEKINREVDKNPPMGWTPILEKIYYENDFIVTSVGHRCDKTTLKIIDDNSKNEDFSKTNLF